MDVFVIVEMFKGGIMPEIRGVYQDEMKSKMIIVLLSLINKK